MSEFKRVCVAAAVVCVMSGLVALVERWTSDWSVEAIVATVVGAIVIVVVLLPWSATGKFIWQTPRRE